MQIIIDGMKIINKEEFHKCIKEILELPDYYGENLDALWDCITGWVTLPLEIVWNNFEYSKQRLGDYIIKILDIFRELEEELGKDFKIIFI